jgi:hypothetical protein
MAIRKVDAYEDCIETIRHSKVKVTDPGTARVGILVNPDQEAVRRIKMDGCLALMGTVAADFVISKAQAVDVIVELKGKNVDHAVEQIEATLRFWSAHERHEAGQLIGAWIICSEYPRGSTKVARYRESFRARGSILLFSTRNGEEKHFSEFQPGRK